MKHKNLFVLFLLAVLASIVVACVPQAAQPVTKPAGTIEEKVLSFEYSEDPAFPIDYSGDLNTNPWSRARRCSPTTAWSRRTT